MKNDKLDISGKKVAVVAFGIEGHSIVRYLMQNNAGEIMVADEKQENEFSLELVRELREKGVSFNFGSIPELESFDLIIRTPGLRPSLSQFRSATERGVSITTPTKIFFEEFPGTIVGVTGTKGKGTTSSFIYEMLKRAGKDAVLCGNVGVPAISVLDEATSDTIAVCELSSFQLIDLEESPHIAVVLMVTEDHLDYHKDREEYVKAKENIVRYQKPEDVAIVNADYPDSVRIGKNAPGEVRWVSRKNIQENGCFVENGKIVIAGNGKREEIFETKKLVIPGEHNLENVCASTLTASLFDIPISAIKEVLATFHGLPYRLEQVGEIAGVRYINDSISTIPDSAIAAIKAFPEAPKVLILGGSSKGADFNGLAKEIISDITVSAIVGIGEEWPAIREAIESDARDLGQAPPEMIEGAKNMEEVVRLASSVAGPGSVVILSPACASFGMFSSYKERGDLFREEVKKLASIKN